jgi:hypothetical protein
MAGKQASMREHVEQLGQKLEHGPSPICDHCLRFHLEPNKSRAYITTASRIRKSDTRMTNPRDSRPSHCAACGARLGRVFPNGPTPPASGTA